MGAVADREAPALVSMTASVRCSCGEVYEFDGIQDGWQHIVPCDDCGRRLSIQVDEPIVQYDCTPAAPSPVAPSTEGGESR